MDESLGMGEVLFQHLIGSLTGLAKLVKKVIAHPLG
jgi:hypothetical protein